VAGMRRAMNEFSAGHLVDDITMLVIRVGSRSHGRALRKPASRRRP